MWKLIVAFVIFAGLAIWMLSKGGDVSMGGETHSGDFHAAPAASAAASAAVDAAASAVAAPASAASN
jgi:cytosine/uracil/thiamine/allantoin permease